jgi:hypothetical protein
MHFHTYHDGAEVYIDPLNPTEIAQYKRDSDRALNERWKRKYAHIKTMWKTVTQWTVALVIGSLFASHTIYA